MRPWEDWAAEPPSGQLKLNSPEVFKFLDTLLDDIIPRTSPFTSYLHVGGDEVKMKAFELDETVNSSATEVVFPYLQRFFDHVFAKVMSHDFTPLVWEEIVLEYDVQVPSQTIIQSWRSQDEDRCERTPGYIRSVPILVSRRWIRELGRRRPSKTRFVSEASVPGLEQSL